MGLKTNFRKFKSKFNDFKAKIGKNLKALKIYLFQNNSQNHIFHQRLSLSEILMYYTPDWYHDFTILGLPTFQLPEDGAKEAQEDKQYIIFDYIKRAVEYIKQNFNEELPITGVELFCADGFYSNYAVQNGIDSMMGIDLEDLSGEGGKRSSVLDQARLATKLLNNSKKAKFQKGDVFNLKDSYDICLCLGGLYHLEDPEKLIALLKEKINKVLIVQTVVSLETEDENYFETPCPGWNWGCRFSHNYLKKMLDRNGWKIIKEDRNEIIWNQRLCDRGSSYILCIPQQ